MAIALIIIGTAIAIAGLIVGVGRAFPAGNRALKDKENLALKVEAEHQAARGARTILLSTAVGAVFIFAGLVALVTTLVVA